MTKGPRVIDSTPPARTRFASDEQTARAACATASSPDAHNLFTVVPGQETGIPASNADIRATLRLSSPAWFAQPRMTSSMDERSEEHTSELQSLMRISYAVFCLKKKKNTSQYNQQ